MPRANDTIDDRTPLSAARIDVAARIGWLLRVHRTTAGVSLRQMSVALREHGVNLSAATLSRAESEGQRSPQLLDGYTRVLGLPEGALRADVDGLCRAFSYAPPALPEPEERCLTAYTRACDAVQAPDASAGDWLTFAQEHARPGGYGLPTSLMAPLVQRLAREVGLGVFRARFIRHEALLVLQSSPYGDLVASVLRDTVDDPDHQNFYDLTSVLSDNPSPAVVEWAGDMLSHPSLFHVRGASYLLQGLLVGGGLGFADWKPLVPRLEHAWDQARGDLDRETVVRQVARALPPPLQTELGDAIGVRPSPPQASVAWSRTRNNPHYAFATSIARSVCARRGQPDEPLLERLLFEAFFEPRGVRLATSAWLIAGSPFTRDLVEAIIDARDLCPDPDSRAASLRVAALCHAGGKVPPAVHVLLGSDEPGDFMSAVTILGRSGQALPDAALAKGLSGDETTIRQTLYCLGMAGDPRLADLAADESLSSQTRRGAAWWIEQGSRILV